MILLKFKTTGTRTHRTLVYLGSNLALDDLFPNWTGHYESDVVFFFSGGVRQKLSRLIFKKYLTVSMNIMVFRPLVL